MLVKDVVTFFDNLDGLNYRVLGEFYGEDGLYIGDVDRDCSGNKTFISKPLYYVWRNRVKFSWVHTMGETTIYTYVVLKGEEK